MDQFSPLLMYQSASHYKGLATVSRNDWCLVWSIRQQTSTDLFLAHDRSFSMIEALIVRFLTRKLLARIKRTKLSPPGSRSSLKRQHLGFYRLSLDILFWHWATCLICILKIFLEGVYSWRTFLETLQNPRRMFFSHVR